VTNRRKYIRIALNAQDAAVFMEAKAKAEQTAGIKMSDGAFALGVIRKAIDAD
jgi:hypothetical protein